MKEQTIYEIKGLYRDDFRVTGYTFGAGEPAICIIGSMRGNENQQLFCCSALIQKLTELEQSGLIAKDKQILVIPCANPYSMNIKKRFWSIDNTDINRMFPGYNLGETTQRIAAGIFDVIKEYPLGIQFASFYMPGAFVPHVRMMKTGFENVELAKQFGLPYIVLHNPRPFDTTTLNYNWQIWETQAFSIYTTSTQTIDRKSASQAVEAILRFMSCQNIIPKYPLLSSFVPYIMESSDWVSVRAEYAGFFETFVQPGEAVCEGQTLARIYHPYTGALLCTLHAPIHGIVAFVHNEALTYADTAVIKLIKI